MSGDRYPGFTVTSEVDLYFTKDGARTCRDRSSGASRSRVISQERRGAMV